MSSANESKDRLSSGQVMSHSTKFDPPLSLEELRRKVASFAEDRNWNQFHTPRNLLLALVGEVGELSEIFQWRGDDGCPPGLDSWSEADKVHLGEEMSDVLIYLIRLADRCNINLTAAALDKMDKNGKKYPVDKAFGSNKKYTAYVDADTVTFPKSTTGIIPENNIKVRSEIVAKKFKTSDNNHS